jgi:hypothetical protein
MLRNKLMSVLLNIDLCIVFSDSFLYSLSILVSLGLQLLTVWLCTLMKSLTREAFLELMILLFLLVVPVPLKVEWPPREESKAVCI